VWVAGAHADGAIQKTWKSDWLGTSGWCQERDEGLTGRCTRSAIRAPAHASAPWRRTRRGLKKSSGVRSARRQATRAGSAPSRSLRMGTTLSAGQSINSRRSGTQRPEPRCALLWGCEECGGVRGLFAAVGLRRFCLGSGRE